jgi:hypothetical protein
MKLEYSKEWLEERIALEGDCEIGAGNPHFMKEIKEKISELANKLNITVEELEWVTDFLSRKESGLFRFSPRQLEVLASAYEFRNKSA